MQSIYVPFFLNGLKHCWGLKKAWLLYRLYEQSMGARCAWESGWIYALVVAGWVIGIGWGTYQLVQEGFNSSLHSLGFLGGLTIYIGLSALIANLIVVFVGTGLIQLFGASQSYAMPLSADKGGKTSAQSMTHN